MTQEIRTENLKNHPKNIRKTYGDLKELTASIRENGVLQNLVVVPDPKNEGMFLVVAGNCRLRAARKAGLETLPCNIAQMTEKEQVLTMLTENMQRNGLSVAEEAAGIQMCLEDFGMKVPEVAKATGLSVSTVRSRRNIARLDLATVKEKAGNPDFQISITDLNSLSKVKDVDRRNEILAEATDSKNLKWKVEQAMNDEIREKNLAAFAALLEDAGIEQAKNVSSGDLYGSKWDTIKSFNLLDAVPESLFDGDGNEPADTEGLVYFIQYSCLKLIRKHKAEKRQPTESELAERRIRKSRKEVKGLYRQMHTEMASFVQALMNGQLSQPDDPSGLLTPLWHVIVSKEIYVSASAIISIMAGKKSYQLPEEERAAARERGLALPLYMQMMVEAVKGCNDLELMDHNGHYSDVPATILLTLYGCLNSIGFSFGNDEYDRILDGTHELYEPWEDPAAETEDADDISADDPSADNAGITDSVDADEYVSLLPEGFEEVTDMSEIPFSDGEPDMPAGAIEDEYPTVYSTEDGTAGISVVAHELASLDEAA